MWRLGVLLLAGTGLLATRLAAQEPKPLPGSEDCLGCHETGKRVGKREPGMPPPFDAAALRASPHAELDCRNCHADLEKVTDFPHPEKLKPVDCGGCHTDEQAQYAASHHGKLAAKGDALAPGCKTCHGTHTVQRPSTKGSPTSTFEIPRLCGGCHKEGTPVSQTRNIPQQNILANYTDSIHGQALYEKGLTVTAVCTSCHTAHNVLPPERPEVVDRQGEYRQDLHAVPREYRDGAPEGDSRRAMGEAARLLIPACVDCHEPHEIRQVYYPQGMADRDCLRCHANPALKVRGGRLALREAGRAGSIRSTPKRPASNATREGRRRSSGHARPLRPRWIAPSAIANEVNEYKQSTHGHTGGQGQPGCAGMHGLPRDARHSQAR